MTHEKHENTFFGLALAYDCVETSHHGSYTFVAQAHQITWMFYYVGLVTYLKYCGMNGSVSACICAKPILIVCAGAWLYWQRPSPDHCSSACALAY